MSKHLPAHQANGIGYTAVHKLTSFLFIDILEHFNLMLIYFNEHLVIWKFMLNIYKYLKVFLKASTSGVSSHCSLSVIAFHNVCVCTCVYGVGGGVCCCLIIQGDKYW